MSSETAIFIDTNVLLYANLARSPFHLQAIAKLQTLDAQENELWISRQILREYLSAMTRQGDLTGQIAIGSLVEDVRYFGDRFYIAEDSPDVTESLLALVQQVPTGGRQIYDANIVATMQVHSIQRLLTHNTNDFERFSQVITVLPLI